MIEKNANAKPCQNYSNEFLIVLELEVIQSQATKS